MLEGCDTCPTYEYALIAGGLVNQYSIFNTGKLWDDANKDIISEPLYFSKLEKHWLSVHRTLSCRSTLMCDVP